MPNSLPLDLGVGARGGWSQSAHIGLKHYGMIEDMDEHGCAYLFCIYPFDIRVTMNNGEVENDDSAGHLNAPS